MPLSHTCSRCGMELCRLRAARDPVYALPVVVCPRCSEPSLRRRHAIIVVWRAALRSAAAAGRFAVQLVLLLFFTLVLSAFLHGVRTDLVAEWPQISGAWKGHGSEAFHEVRRQLVRTGLMWELVAWMCYASGLGAWLVAGFPHWRRFAVVPSWIGAMLLVLGVQAGLDAAMHSIDVRLRAQSRNALDLPRYAWTFSLALVTIGLALPGFGMGFGILALGRAARRRNFRKKLARLRRRRQG